MRRERKTDEEATKKRTFFLHLVRKMRVCVIDGDTFHYFDIRQLPPRICVLTRSIVLLEY